MKTKSWFLLVAVLLAGFGALGWEPPTGGWQVSEKGPNHRQWNRVTTTTNEAEDVILNTNIIVELATGMNRLEKGQWVECNPRIVPTRDGAACVGAGHQVMLAHNLNSRAAVQIHSPQNKWIQGNVLGLAYHDPVSDKSVLIAQIQDSYGTIVDDTHVLYPNAFSGLSADVRYRYTKAGFEQDVILRQQPPAPENYGFSSETAQLIVITEFLNTPTPKSVSFSSPEEVLDRHGVTNVKLRHVAGETNWMQYTSVDQLLDLSGMILNFGKAYALGETAPSSGFAGSSAPMRRHWQVEKGRSFFIEAVSLKDVQDQLGKLLPPPPSAKVTSQGLKPQVVDYFPLPETIQTRIKPKPMPIAPKISAETPGLVLDYNLLVGYGGPQYSDIVFETGKTYVIVGQYSMYGTAVFMGGTVIKYDTSTAPTARMLQCFCWGQPILTPTAGQSISHRRRMSPWGKT